MRYLNSPGTNPYLPGDGSNSKITPGHLHLQRISNQKTSVMGVNHSANMFVAGRMAGRQVYQEKPHTNLESYGGQTFKKDQGLPFQPHSRIDFLKASGYAERAFKIQKSGTNLKYLSFTKLSSQKDVPLKPFSTPHLDAPNVPVHKKPPDIKKAAAMAANNSKGITNNEQPHTNLESSTGRFFKKLFGLPYKGKSQVDVLKATGFAKKALQSSEKIIEKLPKKPILLSSDLQAASTFAGQLKTGYTHLSNRLLNNSKFSMNSIPSLENVKEGINFKNILTYNWGASRPARMLNFAASQKAEQAVIQNVYNSEDFSINSISSAFGMTKIAPGTSTTPIADGKAIVTSNISDQAMSYRNIEQMRARKIMYGRAF